MLGHAAFVLMDPAAGNIEPSPGNITLLWEKNESVSVAVQQG